MSPDVLTGLAAIFGAGGIGGIVTGYLAYKTEAAKGRREPMKSADLPANGSFPGSADFELLTNAITMLITAVNKIAALLEGQIREHEREEEAADLAERREMQEVLRDWRENRTPPAPLKRR